MWEAVADERGSRRRDYDRPGMISGTQAEDAAYCHNSGALSQVEFT